MNEKNHLTLITDGMIYDGCGGVPFVGDILLEHDRIKSVTVSGTIPRTGCRVVSVRGAAVSPGFIDVHAHSDLTLLAAPDAAGKISQGITTEISGNCGQSFFPVTELNRDHLRKSCENYGVSLDWETYSGYIDRMMHAGPAVNYNFLCGQNTLHAAVTGYADVAVSSDNMNRMKELLRSALSAGCPGLSTGLIYVPGRFASRDELEELCSVLRNFDAVYATHMRSESDSLLEALDEALFLAGCGSGRLEISHLKTAKPRNWNKLAAVFDRVENARKKGLRVTADRYPYTFSQTSLSVVLPDIYEKMTDSDIQKVLGSSPGECIRVGKELRKRTDWDKVILSFTSLPEYRSLPGKNIVDAAGIVGMTPADFVVDVLRRDASRAQGAFGGLSPDNMEQIIAKDWVCCGTDENARPFDESAGRSHPRGFGSFPRFLQIAQKYMPLAEAIRKVTSLPASVFRLSGRGVLKPGYFADIVIFDPEKIRDTADFSHPHSPAAGIHSVWVNGICAYRPGEPIRRAGRKA